MSGSSLNIVLVCEESAGMQTLRLLIRSPHHLVTVVTSESDAPSSIWTVAQKAEIETIPAADIRLPDFASRLVQRNTDVLLNVHSLCLIPGNVLEACRVGAFNLHPGPLPQYAGLDVPNWAIYNGERRHGVTLHHMATRVDAGFIAYHDEFDIGPSDTGLTLMSRCVRAGIPLVEQLLTQLYADAEAVPRLAQDLTQRHYYRREPPNGGWLDWTRTAAEVARHVRASDYLPFASPWGFPQTMVGHTRVQVLKAEATDIPTDTKACGLVKEVNAEHALVAASDNLVRVRTIALPDSTITSPVDFLKPGMQLRALNSETVPM